MPKLVILCGWPGSGKSTYTIKHFPDFVRISQDANKGRRDVTWNQFRQAIDSGKNVVLDRCNVTKSQRSPWINYGMQGNYEIEGIFLECDPEVAVIRVENRKNHETIVGLTLEKIHEIVFGFYKTYEPMELNEGFKKILMLRNY